VNANPAAHVRNTLKASWRFRRAWETVAGVQSDEPEDQYAALKSKHYLVEAPTKLNGVTLKIERQIRRPVRFPYRPRLFGKRNLVAYDLLPDGFLETPTDEAWKARKTREMY
jgi:hypothetical protein